jgi:hypothetical protein
LHTFLKLYEIKLLEAIASIAVIARQNLLQKFLDAHRLEGKGLLHSKPASAG